MHPVRYMGYHADLRRNGQTSRAVKENISSSKVDQNIWLHDQLKSEKPSSKSYADLHHEVKQTLGDGLLFTRKSLGNYHKQSFETKGKDDELVKHMSNLPRYLQRVDRGENLQEKVLNFGVLDWGRLEKWKYNQKPVMHRPIMYSPSTSNTSSPFSTVGSSTMSSRSDSSSINLKKQPPPQGAHLASLSKDCHSIIVKPTRTHVAALQDKRTVSKNASVGHQNITGTNVSGQRNHSHMKFEKGMKDNVNSNLTREMGTSSSKSNNCEVPFSRKGKTKVSDGDHTQNTESFQESTSDGQQCPGRDKTIVLLLPKNISNKKFSDPSCTADFTTLNSSKQTETSRSSFSDGFCTNEAVEFSELCPEIQHSRPEFSRIETRKQFELDLPNTLGSKPPSDVSHFLPHSGEVHNVRSEHIKAEENKLTTKSTEFTATGSKGSTLKAEESPSAKRGNQSPNRWPSAGKGKVSRSLSFKENSALPQLSSTYLTTKSGPVESVTCSDTSNRDKSTTTSRGRSSPLRRLLDPLLGPKTTMRLSSVHDEGHTVCKSSDRPFPSVPPVKRSINFSGSIPADTEGSQRDEKHSLSMVQALLQVTVKNGLPWFTFAVDSNSDILAATMRKTSSSEKYDCSWIYTFYSFRKAKKKGGGWMGHGSKAKTPDYVPNVVGQLKVNGSCCNSRKKLDSNGPLSVREFVLFDVRPSKTDQETTNLVSKVELAAIVIKVPTETTGSLPSDRQQSNNHEGLSNMGLQGFAQNEEDSRNKIINPRSGPSIVVVLPSGVHGLSATGSPSPLLDRWKSGGSCDCGGWDVGCQLRFLSNRDEGTKKSDSSELCFTRDKFDLFVQGGGPRESIPSFRFATCDKGVHSVDFNRSLSALQAFTICIAYLHCKNLAKVSNLFQEITEDEHVSMESERTKLSTHTEGNAPSSCTPFPPPSPVGRV